MSASGRKPTARSTRFAFISLLLCIACAACSSSRYAARWDGRRGYDGHGDYGYDLAASNAEARSYRSRAARSYPIAGAADDPWGPYIQEAANRFRVPEQWIREVMQQESGGQLYGADGALITSSAGAMGLMQVMPQTYDALRERYGFGADPYDPYNNILAGAAYIREMYDRYGAPGFLAAYNAGPDRLDAYLVDGSPLPDETVSYVASIAPRLGGGTRLSGPLSEFAKVGSPEPAGQNADYASGIQYPPTSEGSADDDPSNRAFNGGGLVTAEAPTGVLPSGLSATPYSSPGVPVQTTGQQWGIQVGAYADPGQSVAAIQVARGRAGALLIGAQPAIAPVQRGATLYRARLMGLSPESASAACAILVADGEDCFTVRPGT